jgi:hypothetical protein
MPKPKTPSKGDGKNKKSDSDKIDKIKDEKPEKKSKWT